MPEPLLQLRGIEKSFAGARALKQVDLEIGEGEVVGLVGENGAGKSTLIRIVSGVLQPDAGAMVWRGREARFNSPRDALEAGIATIHQELNYFGQLTVAENLLFEEMWPRRWWGGIDWPDLHARARARLLEFELAFPPEMRLAELSAAQKQEVAIVRALSRQARLLILDEPTASLGENDVHRLFQHLQRLRHARVAILYVSHRLDEILTLTERVVVLRDGEQVGNESTARIDLDWIIRRMVGRPLEQVYPHTRRGPGGEPVLELRGVTKRPMFEEISLNVRPGEIVGLAGLVGAGRSELGRAIYGLYPLDKGEMRLNGRPWNPSGPQAAVHAGVVYLPEERKRQGLVPEHSVRHSIAIGFSDLISRWGLIQSSDERERVQGALERFLIRAASADQAVGELSGGNQQKAMLARWLEREPRVIILDEPTRGVDVGAKAEIHALIDRLADSGKAIVLISSDLPEVLGMSDRVLVLHRGRLAAEFSGAAMTQENVIRSASGLAPASVVSPK